MPACIRAHFAGADAVLKPRSEPLPESALTAKNLVGEMQPLCPIRARERQQSATALPGSRAALSVWIICLAHAEGQPLRALARHAIRASCRRFNSCDPHRLGRASSGLSTATRGIRSGQKSVSEPWHIESNCVASCGSSAIEMHSSQAARTVVLDLPRTGRISAVDARSKALRHSANGSTQSTNCVAKNACRERIKARPKADLGTTPMPATSAYRCSQSCRIRRRFAHSDARLNHRNVRPIRRRKPVPAMRPARLSKTAR
jgi:hypothetical protein